MKTIVVTSGVGHGVTKLDSFDAALYDAGIANYNLIELSSVIPPGIDIVTGKWITSPEHYGHRLYLVKSEAYAHFEGLASTPVAGVAWVQREDKSGLFVEITGQDQDTVEYNMTRTLENMMERRGWEDGNVEVQSLIACGTRESAWTCALVAAVYGAEGWD